MPSRKPSVADRMDAGLFRRTDREQGSNGVSEPRSSGTEESSGPAKAKRSYMLPAATVVTLERIQLADLIRTGEKPDLSELVAEAIAMLGKARGVQEAGG